MTTHAGIKVTRSTVFVTTQNNKVGDTTTIDSLVNDEVAAAAERGLVLVDVKFTSTVAYDGPIHHALLVFKTAVVKRKLSEVIAED